VKPVFEEGAISKLKGIIDSVMNIENPNDSIVEVIDSIESSIKSYQDEKENQILLFGTAALVVILSLVLMYTNKASWPLMFIIVWVGAFMFYRVHEKGLVIDSLNKQSQIDPHNPIPKMHYLESQINLKLGRKDVLKWYMSILLSSAVMMAHHLFVDTSVSVNIFLLIGAIVASYFFWDYFFKEDSLQLIEMKDQLGELREKLILDGGLF